MTNAAKNTMANIIPTLRYRDAVMAIDWLCRAFGFEKHLVVPGDEGGIAHAQLVFGNGMITKSKVVRAKWSEQSGQVLPFAFTAIRLIREEYRSRWYFAGHPPTQIDHRSSVICINTCGCHRVFVNIQANENSAIIHGTNFQ